MKKEISPLFNTWRFLCVLENTMAQSSVRTETQNKNGRDQETVDVCGLFLTLAYVNVVYYSAVLSQRLLVRRRIEKLSVLLMIRSFSFGSIEDY